MEEQHSNLLRHYRSRFAQSVEVGRLYPMLVNTKVLSRSETDMLDQLPSEEERVGRLLDMLPSKGRLAFESLCLALETTYPHLLTVMFLGNTMTHKGSLHSQSTVSSSASESDMDDLRGVPRLSLPDFSDKDGHSESSGMSDPRHHERSYDEISEQQADVLNNEYTDSLKRTQCDAEGYRNDLHSASMSEHQLLRRELEEAKRDLRQVAAERDCLRSDLEELRHVHEEDTAELEKLWRQNKEIMRLPESSDPLQKMYDAALEKIDDLTKNIRQLRMRNNQLVMERDTLGGKAENCGGQVAALQSQIDGLRTERASIKAQLNSCQQQYMKVMRELHMSHKERDDILKREQVLKKFNTDTVMEYNQVLSAKKDLEIAVRRAEDQRKATAIEYSTVMGERDGVLKENNQLQNEAEMEKKKREEAEHRIWILEQELDMSKRRMQDSQQELEIALRDVENLSDCYRDMLNNKKERDKALKDFEKFKEQRDVARKERMEALDQRDMLLLKYYDAEQQQKAMSNERNLANRDVEQMRSKVDSLQRQLKEALQETAKAKNMRDWAFKERDKVVQERESIRTLSDQMRKERDLTVNKLAESLRKVDDMENQRNKSVRDFQEIRDKMQSQSEREARMRQLIAQHSKDSAIDADYLEWETETVELDGLHLINGIEDFSVLGFDVAECTDHAFFPEDCSIYVTKVEKGSPAQGKIRVNDCLIRINDIDLSTATRQGVQQALANCQNILIMVVKRRRSHACRLVPLKLNISRGNPLVLDNGVFVTGTTSGSQSLRELGVIPGDRIFMVNNTPMENKTVNEVESLLACCQNPVNVTVVRLSSTPVSVNAPTSASPTVDSFQSRDASSTNLSALLSATETSDGGSHGDQRMLKETSVQTDAISERKLSREMSFRSTHSREDSRESNATQGTLKAADWEEAKASHQYNVAQETLKALEWQEAKAAHQHMQGNLEASGWEDMDASHQHAGVQGPVKPSDWVDLDTVNPPQNMRSLQHSDWEVKTSSRQYSMDSNDHSGVQRVLRDSDWEVKMASPQHGMAQGALNSSDWEVKASSHQQYPPDLGDGNAEARRGGHSRQHSREDHIGSPPLKHEPRNHRKDLSSSGIPPDYSKTVKRRRVVKKDHWDKVDYNLTWPKSRGPPPDIFGPVRTDLVTVTPIKNSDTYHDAQEEVTVVIPPKPPSRNSSFHAAHHHSSSSSSGGSRRKNSNSSQPSPVGGTSGSSEKKASPVSPLAVVRSIPMSSESWSPPSNGYRHGSGGATIATSSKVVPTRKWNDSTNGSSNPDRPVSMPPYLDPNHQHGQTLPRRTGPHSPRSPQPSYPQPMSPKQRPPPLHFASNSNPVTVEDYDSFPRSHNPPSAPAQTHYVRDRPHVPSFVVTSKSMTPNASMVESPTSSGYNTIPYSASKGSKVHSISSLPEHRWAAARRGESWDKRDSRTSLPPGRDFDSFQVNKSQRIHIPSRPSYSNSSNSLEIGSSYTSGRSSPTSPSIPEISSDSSHNSLSEAGVIVTTQGTGRRDDVRRIEIQKSHEQLGFAITEGAKEGIFVRSVTPNSLAAEGNMCYGDQILEFNGVNLRQATKSQAASIMGRMWNKVNMLVQYNPSKMNDRRDVVEDDAGCSTNPNSPMARKRPQSDLVSVDGTITPPTPRASRIYENLPNDELLAEDIRRIYMKNTNSVLGVTIAGGNAVGIFIAEILPDSVAAQQSGLRVGDQILEYNSMSFKAATAEQATMELQKPAEDIRLYVQYNITKYNSVQGLCGDALYVRCLVDYNGSDEDHLTFKKEDILFVNNTLYNHELGVWGAHHVKENGKTTTGGSIPSKNSLCHELLMRPSASEEKLEEGFRKKTPHGGRRSSFFRRKKGHRSNSKDGRDYNDGMDITSQEEIPTYQRVDRLDMRTKRPVVLLGPHNDKVASKLVDESPDKFKRVPESKRASVQDLDMDMADSIFLESPQPEGFYECIPTQAIQDICESGSHCVLDGVSPAICKRLNNTNLCPIIIFIKFKSSKQIREQKDPHFLREKVSHKQAKDLFERAHQVEQDYRNMFTDTVAGGNLASMCTRVKEVIDREQKRVMWVPSSLPL